MATDARYTIESQTLLSGEQEMETCRATFDLEGPGTHLCGGSDGPLVGDGYRQFAAATPLRTVREAR
jgi:hypothetical protein